jgi:hypothetical protein
MSICMIDELTQTCIFDLEIEGQIDERDARMTNCNVHLFTVLKKYKIKSRDGRLENAYSFQLLLLPFFLCIVSPKEV